MTDVRGRRRASATSAPGCGGGRRCSSPAACTSCTRSCGTSSARPAATRVRPTATPSTSSTSRRRCTSTSSPTLQQWYLDLPGQRADPPVERVLRHRPLPRDVRRARVDVPARPAPPPAAAQHARAHHLPRGDRLRGLLADAAAAARRPRRVRRLPDLRAGGGGRRRARRAHRAGLRRVRLRRHRSPRYGGWISFGNEGYEDVSNQYAAMPSMHIGWATWTRDRARARWCAAGGREGSPSPTR